MNYKILKNKHSYKKSSVNFIYRAFFAVWTEAGCLKESITLDMINREQGGSDFCGGDLCGT